MTQPDGCLLEMGPAWFCVGPPVVLDLQHALRALAARSTNTEARLL
jgi:hypothetical protein